MLERRYKVSPEFRASMGDDGWFQQRVAVFDVAQQIYPWLMEEVAPTAFDATIKEDDPVALFNHDPNKVLGRQSAKTAEFPKDEVGLFARYLPGDTSIAKDLQVWTTRGDVRGGSFSFVTRPNGETNREDSNGVVHRRLLAVTLYDAGPVTFPAYPDTAFRSEALAKELSSLGDADADLAQQALYRLRHGMPLSAELRSVLIALGLELRNAASVEVVKPTDPAPETEPAQPEAIEEPTGEATPAVENPVAEVEAPAETNEPVAEPLPPVEEKRDALSVLALRLALAKREMGEYYPEGEEGDEEPASEPEMPMGPASSEELRAAMEELLKLGAHDGPCDFGSPCGDCGVPKRACSKHSQAMRTRTEAAMVLLARA